MTMKKSLLSLAYMMSAVMDSYSLDSKSYRKPETEQEKLEREKRHKKAEIERNKAQGLKEFDYGRGNTLWALNQKSADKKAKKKGWI